MAVETMAVTSHFADISKEDRDKLLYDAVPKSTRVAIAFWIRVFEDFCKSQKIVCDLESVDEDPLLMSWRNSTVPYAKRTAVSTSGVVTLLLEVQSSGILMILVEG